MLLGLIVGVNISDMSSSRAAVIGDSAPCEHCRGDIRISGMYICMYVPRMFRGSRTFVPYLVPGMYCT
jgi:hypothetical protein